MFQIQHAPRWHILETLCIESLSQDKMPRWRLWPGRQYAQGDTMPQMTLNPEKQCPHTLCPGSNGVNRGQSKSTGVNRGQPGSNRVKWGQTGSNGVKRGQTGSNRFKRGRTGSNWVERGQTGSNGVERGQTG